LSSIHVKLAIVVHTLNMGCDMVQMVTCELLNMETWV